MINSVPGGQAVSTIYWYEQLRRYAVQRSVAVSALLVSSLLGIVTLVLLAACGLAAGSHGFAAQARLPVLAVAAAILVAAVLGRRQFVPAALWAVRHLGGATPRPSSRSPITSCRCLCSAFSTGCSTLQFSSLPSQQSARRSQSVEWSLPTRLANSSPRSRFFRAAAARSKRP